MTPLKESLRSDNNRFCIVPFADEVLQVQCFLYRQAVLLDLFGNYLLFPIATFFRHISPYSDSNI